jgi:hypothetical protein
MLSGVFPDDSLLGLSLNLPGRLYNAIYLVGGSGRLPSV